MLRSQRCQFRAALAPKKDSTLLITRDVQLQKLAKYRDEIHAFTDFLKNIYAIQHAEERTTSL